jgi:putative transposase
MLTEIGLVEIEVPRDVKKRQRRFTGVDQIVLSLSARGLTTGEISIGPRFRRKRRPVEP